MRVAIVNDMVLATEVLRRLLQSAPGYTICWTAADGAEAVQKAIADRPDVILMDLIMPVMDGVEATRRMMQQAPCPILLVTSSVRSNFNLVYAAMGHGAIDAVDTPVMGSDGKIAGGERLLDRLNRLQRTRMSPLPVLPEPPILTNPPLGQPSSMRRTPLVALGASTGGPEALATILSAISVDFSAAIVVVQHIDREFIPSLKAWLQSRSKLPIVLTEDGMLPRTGEVYLASTNDHIVMRSDGTWGTSREPENYPYRPSIDVLFGSLVHERYRPGVAALLTGMGSDGARGLLQLKRAGWMTLAQNEASSVVYGMPKAAADLGAAVHIVPLAQMSTKIIEAHASMSR